MGRIEILQLKRKKIFVNLSESKDNRAKWLTELMDIDDEMEELKDIKHKTKLVFLVSQSENGL